MAGTTSPGRRLAHLLVATVLIGGPLAWILAPLWPLGLLVALACGVAGALRGEAFWQAVAASEAWAVVRGWLLLRGR